MFFWLVSRNARQFDFVLTCFFFDGQRRFKLQLGNSGAETEGDSEAIIRTKALENGVLALPGTIFLPSGRKSTYVRASFSLLPEDQVDEALRRLREVILEARGDSSA